MATAAYPAPLPRNTHSIAIGYLCWVFGFLGMHRFYYGKPVTGMLWFFTLGLLSIAGLIYACSCPSMDTRADRGYWPGGLDYTIEWLLRVWLGPLGIHRFYVGKVVTGMIWLFTPGLCSLGWLYELWTLNDQITEINA